MTTPAPGWQPGRAVERSDQTKFTAPTPTSPASALRLGLVAAINGTRALRELLDWPRQNPGLQSVARHNGPSAAAGLQPAPEGLLDRRAAWLAEAERRRAGQ